MRPKVITQPLTRLSEQSKIYLAYAVVACTSLVAIFVMNDLFIDQNSFNYVHNSAVTLNFILALGMWGWFTEWLAKKRKWTKRKQIIFYVVATSIVFVFLRIAGMQTRFG